MSRRKYPAWGGEGAYSKLPGKECACCDKQATHWVRIEWSFMRGEDSSEPVCNRHKKMAFHNWSRFIAHYYTKDKFLGREQAS